MTKHEDKNEQPLCKDANHERSIRFTSSELALHAIEDSHPAREWLEKIRKHTRELGALLQKLIALKQSKRGEQL